jgi:hypothetical protein
MYDKHNRKGLFYDPYIMFNTFYLAYQSSDRHLKSQYGF